MRRIPSFDPSIATTNAYINVGAGGNGCKVLLYNESPFNLDLDFLNGSNSILHAWEARSWTVDADTRQIGWTIDTSLNVSNPPISLVMGEIYDANEKIEGSYPMALIRQASVGNPGGINTNVSGTAAIVNDGNPDPTSIIESTVVGQTLSSIQVYNDGTATIKAIIAAALVQILKLSNTDPVVTLGAAAHAVEILGTTTHDDITTGTQFSHDKNSINNMTTGSGFYGQNSAGAKHLMLHTLSIDNDVHILTSPSPGGGNLKISNSAYNTDIAVFNDTAGLTLKVGAYHFLSGNMSRVSVITGTSSVTVNHNLGATPDWVCPVQSVAGSATIGYSGTTSTQVSVGLGTTNAWTAFCMKQ